MRPPNPDPNTLFALKHASEHAHIIFENNYRKVVLLKTEERTKKHELQCVLDFDIDSVVRGVAENVRFYPKNQIPASLGRRIVGVPHIKVLMEYMDKVITENDAPKLINSISMMSVNKLSRQSKNIIGSNQDIFVISLPETLLAIDLKAIEKPIFSALAALVARLKESDYLKPVSS